MAKSNTDFNALWNMFYHEMIKISNDRYKALLKNHEGNKERICRKLGIVTPQDVHRLSKSIAMKHS
jgi:hypothetical protein